MNPLFIHSIIKEKLKIKMKNQNYSSTSSRSSLLIFGKSGFKKTSNKKHIHTSQNLNGGHDDSTNISIHDISQSLLGRTLRLFNLQTSLLSKQNLAYFRQQNNQDVSSRHGFVSCAKQLQLRGSVTKYNSYSIDEFNHILKYQADNQFEAYLKSYDRFYWEPDFRKALLNTIYDEMANQKSIINTSLEETFFDSIDQKFYLKKGINVMKTFQVSSTLVQNVKAFPYKIDRIEQRKLKLFKMFSEQRIDELIEKYSKQQKESLQACKAEKIQNKKINFLFYKANKTDFKDRIYQNFATFQILNHVRRQNDLKLLAIKFHCRMMRSFYLNISYYCRNLGLKSQFGFEDFYERLTKKFPPREQQKQKEENKRKVQLQDLNEQEIIVCQIRQCKIKLSQLEGDINSIAHFNTAIRQFQEQLFKNQVTKVQGKQLFRIEQKLQQTLMYIESSIVTQVRYIQKTDLFPKRYQQAIQLLIDRDELVNLIIHIDSIINQHPLLSQWEKSQKSQIQILNLIKNSLPQLQLLLSSYANMTTSLLNQILEKYLFDFRDFPNNLTKKKSIAQSKIASTSEDGDTSTSEDRDTSTSEDRDTSTSEDGNKSTNFQKQKKQTLKQWVKDLHKHMALYNFVMISYKFSQQAPFNIKYFCIKQGIQLPINYDTFRSNQRLNTHTSDIFAKYSSQTASKNSKTLRKLSFFWRTFQKPHLLKRIYESSTLCLSQIKQIKNNISFSFQTIFKYYINYDEINYYKIRYYVHFAQYFLEIISDLSSANNTSLAATFNSIRFLILNFVCFFYIQSAKRIEKEIKEKHGDLYYNAFKNQMKNSKRVANNQSTLIDAVQISRQKILKYLNELQNNFSGTNPRKLDKIFTSIPFIKELFFELNIQEPIYKHDKIILKDHTKALQMEYNFDIARKCYLSILALITKELMSKSVLQRIIKRLIPITQEQANLSKPSHQETKQFLKKCNQSFQPMIKGQKTLQLFLQYKNLDSNEVYQTYFQKFIFSFLEISKLSVMILSMPFYSYENDLEYQRKKTFEKLSLKKRDSSNSKNNKILYNLDNFYIYQRNKVSFDFLRSLMRKFRLVQFFCKYISKVNQVFGFLNQQSIKDKMQIFQRQVSHPDIEKLKIRYPKYLHTQYLSIYSKLQLQQFFLSYNQQNLPNESKEEDRHLRLQPDFCHALNQFFKICKAMETRAKNVMKEVKKYQLLPSEVGLVEIQEKQNSDKEEDEKNDNTTKGSTYSLINNPPSSRGRNKKLEYQ